jgi:hypothetical protein
MPLITELVSFLIESPERDSMHVANLIIASGLTIGIIRTAFLALRESKSITKKLQN